MALRTPLSVTPHLYMGDSTGRPLDMGTVYFGEQDKDPEFYPINLFSDDALTKPLAQPVHTKGGYLYDKGDMVEPHAKELIYSVKVLDSYGRKVFYKGAMMRNSWNDDVIEQINTAIVGSADVARQVATDITNDAINNTAVEGGVLADTFVTVTTNLAGSVPRSLRDVNADSVHIKTFGGSEDLSYDNTAALQAAAATGRVVELGGVYTIKGIVDAPKLRIKNGSLLLSGATSVINSGTTELDSVKIKATSKKQVLISKKYEGDIVISKSEFADLHSDTYVQAINVIHPCDIINITKTVFSDLTSLADGVIGNTNGSARAIYIAAPVKRLDITGNIFKNINNVNSAGINVLEDADAVQVVTTTNAQQNINVSNNSFENVGKRFLKVQGGIATEVAFNNNNLDIAWVDGVSGQMHAALSLLGECSGTVVGNTCAKGSVKYFVEFSPSSNRSLVVDKNTCTIVNGVAFVQGGTTVGVPLVSKVSIINNPLVSGFTSFADNAGEVLTVKDNVATGVNAGVGFRNTTLICTGNIFVSASNVGRAVSLVANNNKATIISGNVFMGFQDSITLTGDAATSAINIQNNTLLDAERSPLSNQTTNRNTLQVTGNITNHANGISETSLNSTTTFYNNGVATASTSSKGWDISIPEYTTASLAQASSVVNTKDKRKSKLIINSDSNKMMLAAGGIATSNWVASDGTTITPV